MEINESFGHRMEDLREKANQETNDRCRLTLLSINASKNPALIYEFYLILSNPYHPDISK